MDKNTEKSWKRLISFINKYYSLEKKGKITEAKEVRSKWRQERKNWLDLMSKGNESDRKIARAIKRMKKIELP